MIFLSPPRHEANRRFGTAGVEGPASPAYVPSPMPAAAAANASPFQYRDYRAFWAARLASTIGSTMLVVVLGLHVYDVARQTMSIKEASFWLGMIGLAQFLPLFLLTL